MKGILSATVAGIIFLIAFIINGSAYFGIACVVLALLAIALLFKHKRVKSNAKAALAAENANLIAQGRKSLTEIRTMSAYISDKDISKSIVSIYEVGTRIIEYLSKNSEDMHAANTFFEYYLPRLSSILSHVKQIEQNRLKDDASLAFKEKSKNFLTDVITAFENLLSKLHKEDVLGSSIDIDVMETTLRREGLLDDDVFKFKLK